MTRAAQNGTIPRPKPCDELQVEQRHLRPMKLSDEPQSNASCFSSDALHSWHSSGGFGYPSDSFGRSVPILNAASRSDGKLSACFQGRPLASDEAR